MNIMREYCKEKVRALVSYRTNLFTCLIVLTGGVFGMLFTNVSKVKILILGIIGAYFSVRFLLNIFSINEQIDRILEELK